jgi:hypothetical protein
LEDRYRKCKWVKEQWVTDLLKRHFSDDEAKRALLDKYPRHAWQHLPELKAYR